MSDPGEYLTWENFQQLIQAGVPAIYRIVGPHPVDLFVDDGGRRIGLQTSIGSGTVIPASPLSEVDLGSISKDGEIFLELSTTSRILFREFYSFLLSVADNIRDGVDPLLAFDNALSTWRNLLRGVPLLTEEEQLGLMGELWLLERLLGVVGRDALSAWTGPQGEPHDFRLQGTEIEVKVTRGLRRQHMITNLTQLEPSPSHRLYILSLQFEPAGSGKGFDLPSLVAHLRRLLASAKADVADFNRRLENAWGYRDSDREHYKQPFQVRTGAVLVSVDERCPSITPKLLELLGPDRFQRISGVHYTIDLSGLGIADGSAQFSEVLSGKSGA